jgi:hypothetical protein
VNVSATAAPLREFQASKYRCAASRAASVTGTPAASTRTPVVVSIDIAPIPCSGGHSLGFVTP